MKAVCGCCGLLVQDQGRAEPSANGQASADADKRRVDPEAILIDILLIKDDLFPNVLWLTACRFHWQYSLFNRKDPLGGVMPGLFQDVRFALRQLRKNPAFTVTATAML